MKIYLTAGTFDYLKNVENKFPDEMMATMVNESGALLLHETKGFSVFKEPRKYEVLDSVGQIEKEGYVVLNNIPVTEEGRPLFEYQFRGRARMVENEPGFVALRALRPLTSNTYVILTIWENELAFQRWQNSKFFLEAHTKTGSEQGIDSQPKIFASASYVSKYTLT